MLQDIRSAASDLGITVLFHNRWLGIAVTIMLLMVTQVLVHHAINILVVRAVRGHKHASRLEEHKREETLKTFFRTTSGIAIWIVGVILVLVQLHLNLSALLTSAGLIGVIAGIGGQNVIKDCLAGLFIILENQLRVDDVVRITTAVGPISGSVEEVNLRTTRLRDMDGNLHILTNGTIGVITNMTYNYAKINIDVNITYDTDIDLVERLILEAGLATAHDPAYRADVIDPISMLRVDNLGDSTVTLKAVGKVRPGRQWAVAGEFRRRLKQLFDEHKVKAPYQTFVVEEEVAARPSGVKKPKKLASD